MIESWGCKFTTATGRYTETGVIWQTIIHTVFILSAIGIAFVDRLSNIATEEAKHVVLH